jgi:hypothetical protein
VFDVPGEEAGAAAVTATVPAINAAGAAINATGRSTPRARGSRWAAGRRAWPAVEVPNHLVRRRACRAVEVPNRLIAPPRNGNHAHSTCRSFHGPPGKPGISVEYRRKVTLFCYETRVQWFWCNKCATHLWQARASEGSGTIFSLDPGTHLAVTRVRLEPHRAVGSRADARRGIGAASVRCATSRRMVGAPACRRFGRNKQSFGVVRYKLAVTASLDQSPAPGANDQGQMRRRHATAMGVTLRSRTPGLGTPNGRGSNRLGERTAHAVRCEEPGESNRANSGL